MQNDPSNKKEGNRFLRTYGTAMIVGALAALLLTDSWGITGLLFSLTGHSFFHW